MQPMQPPQCCYPQAPLQPQAVMPHGPPPSGAAGGSTRHLMGSAPEGGAPSTAPELVPVVREIRQVRPSPSTGLYSRRAAPPRQPPAQQPQQQRPQQRASDFCGWVVAADDPMDPFSANDGDRETMNIHHNDHRMVFQSISGWTLMVWRSKDDYEAGVAGARHSPRPVAWFDLRRAYDVRLDVGSASEDLIPHRIAIMMGGGNKYFCVEFPDEVRGWYSALLRAVQEAGVQSVRARDTEAHQRKRWPAACGAARALAAGGPLGQRAMAILFHAYDVDCDGCLRVGECMVLLQEMLAGLLHAGERAVGADRGSAVASVQSRLPEGQLFDAALQLRRRCDTTGDGGVRRDDFVAAGQDALREALELGSQLLE